MSITRYNFNTRRCIIFEFKNDKNLQKAKKIEEIANIFKKNIDTWLNMFNLMKFLSIASLVTIWVLCLRELHNLSSAQFRIPIYALCGAVFCFGVLAWLSIKVENNARKEVATYYWAASLVGEGELKDTLKKIGSMKETTYNNWNLTILSDGNRNFSSGEHLNQKEKDLILNALEVTEYIDPKVPEGVCSQSVGATYCPCIPPCVVMKNVVA